VWHSFYAFVSVNLSGSDAICDNYPRDKIKTWMKSQGGYPNGDFRIASENISLQLDLDYASERREFNREAV
jgi:hypothetical protein